MPIILCQMQSIERAAFRSVPAESVVYNALFALKPTTEGPDELPYWFLKLASPCIAAPLRYLFSLSLSSSTVLTQWKSVNITPVPKISQPITSSDFRPVSISSILSRIMEKLLVRSFLYPVFNMPHQNFSFQDQFAFRPTGSTTAAISAIIHTAATMLISHRYVYSTFDCI